MKLLPYNSENGFTLVEVLVALFIIALVILGGGMFFFYGRVTIVREAHRRAAVLVASQRLEELKAAEWDDIASYDPTYSLYYISHSNGWAKDLGKLIDTVPGDVLPDGEMETEAQWKPDGSYDYLKVTVTVNWQESTTNSVSSTTLIAPR